MAEKYIQERVKREKISRASGVVLTIGLHAALIGCFFITGMKYLDPPPPEQTPLILDFEEEEIKRPEQRWDGAKPTVRIPDSEMPENLTQASEAQHAGQKPNEAPEATVGEDGDVEVKEPEREKPINTRALFSAPDNKSQKDTLAPQTAYEASDELKAGHPDGNTAEGEITGAPNAKLAGRKAVGALPVPSFNAGEAGKVVVRIWVDNYGNVQKAQAGVEGTNTTNKTLWQAAYKAAMGAHFNMDSKAPALQEGTITYIFRVIQ